MDEARLDVARFHRGRRTLLWRRGPVRNVAYHAALLIGYLARESFRALRTDASQVEEVARAHGVSATRQRLQSILWTLRYRLSTSEYYRYELFLPERRHLRSLYVPDFDSASVHAGLFGWRGSPLTKAALAARGASEGVPTVPTLALCPPHGDPEILDPGSPHWESDLFTKQDRGGRGRSQRLWRRQADGGYTDGEVRVGSREALLRHLCEVPRDLSSATTGGLQPEVVQPRLRVHRDMSDLTSGGLCTVRVYTVARTDGGRPLVMAPFVKLVTGDAIVDNLAGTENLIAPVRLRDGRVGAPKIRGEGGMFRDATRHPDTNARIEGFVIPQWDGVLDVCRRAHEIFPETPSVGWDVAVTDRGPVVVEGNLYFGSSQGVCDFPLGLTPYTRLIAEWIEAWLRE